MPTDTCSFLVPKGDYKRLIAFQKSECIYDLTCYFIEHYGSRHMLSDAAFSIQTITTPEKKE